MPASRKNRCEPIFDDEDADLRGDAWNHNQDGYARTTYYFPKTATARQQNVEIKAHRIVLRRKLGRSLAAGEVCDHINGNRLDNRRSNLRAVTVKQNAQHRRPSNSTGFRGVHLQTQTGKYRARVRHGKTVHYLGCFDTPEAAAEASRLKRVELGFFGEVAP